MTKVATPTLKQTNSKKINVEYTTGDIAIGVVIGIQCALALSVIVYHLI